jgi:hypothetical protein
MGTDYDNLPDMWKNRSSNNTLIRLRAIPLENRGIAALTNCQACLIKLRRLVYISKQGQKHLLKGAVSNDSIRLG